METLLLKKGFWRNLVLFTTLSVTTVIFGKTGLVDNNLNYLRALPTIYSDKADYHLGDFVLIATADGLSSGLHEKLNFTAANKRTATDLLSGTNPTACGGSVTFTATVRNIDTGSNPTCGSVTFYDGAISLAIFPLSSSNVATYTISSLSPGVTHSITAVYSPSSSGCNFLGSTSPALLQVVNAPSIAAFSTAPADITVSCGAIPATSSLSYTNGLTGLCGISGSVTSTQTAAPGACGGTITETWTATDNFGRALAPVSRTIHVSPAAVASFASVSDITVDCGAATTSSLDYTNGKTGSCEIKGSVTSTLSIQDPTGYCGGDITESWTYTDNCNRIITASRIIHVRQAAEASFASVSDITVDCGAATTSSLAYTNGKTGNCEIKGSVMSTLSIQDPTGYCGGDITESWTYTDNCNRIITASRVIHVRQAAEASFASVSDITVDCGAATTSSLAYTNGKTGNCENKGSVTSTLSIQDPTGYCGGDITESWTYTDNCNRIITASRIIHVRQAAEASFASVSDITVDCGAATTSSLDYTNGKTGNCEIKGSVMSTLSIQDPTGYCGGDITESWTYTDSCNRIITASRIIHVRQAAEASFASVSDITVDCGAATTSSLAYTNGKTGNCEISGSVTSTLSVQDPAGYCGGDITESWIYTDNCNRIITASRIIHVRQAAEASFASVSDITVDCGAATTSSLAYTNGKTGNCEISGSVTSTLSVQDPAGYCGGDITESWIYTDNCNRIITASRIIHVRPIQIIEVGSEDVPCFPGNSGVPKVYICHQTGSTKNPCINICVDRSALAEHLAHGDVLGECPTDCSPARTNPDGKSVTLDVVAHPNPSKNQFTFEIESESNDDINITVLDISGRLIKEITNVKTLSITFGESLPKGVYFAMVQQGNNQKTIKIVKD